LCRAALRFLSNRSIHLQFIQTKTLNATALFTVKLLSFNLHFSVIFTKNGTYEKTGCLMFASSLIYPGIHATRSLLGIGRQHNYRTLEVAVVLLLDETAHHQARQRQLAVLRRHGVNAGLAATPHITLKLGFKCRDPQAVADYLDELAARVDPLPVTLKDFGHFDEGITFWDVLPDAALDRLRRTIVADLDQRFGATPRPLEGDAFRFHVSLAHGLPDSAFRAERDALASERAEHRFTGQQVALLVRCDQQWIDYKSVTLGRPAPRSAA
jgi:2'-5' RNA ligase